MNRQGSFREQLTLTLLLSFGAMLIYNQFFGARNQTPQGPVKVVPAFQQAFAGIAPDGGPRLDENAANKQIVDLQKDIDANKDGDYAYWARLRAGLIKQYILHDARGAVELYSQVITHGANNQTDAQSIFQKGDLLWRQAELGLPSITSPPAPAAAGKPAPVDFPSQEGATTLEQLIHKGRGSSQFLDLQIYVPNGVEAKSDPLLVPSGGFQLARVRDLHGTLANPNPQGILDRVNQYYATTPHYKVFDGAANALGANPQFSYGLVLVLAAILMRIVLQPLTKKQYDSMKGMSLIAPEMKKIQDKYKGEKYKNDSQAQMQMMKEIRELQARHGVNPMASCGWSLVQLPIFFFVVYPFIQHYEAKLELAGASFLWIHNLAQPDIILLVAYGISMFFSFRLSSTPPADDMQRQQQMMMSFVMPLMFPFFLKSYPSAFTLYWMTFNIISTAFQFRMMKAADPNKDIIKTLFGGIAPVPASDEGGVPSRPRNEIAAVSRVKSIEAKPSPAKATGATSSVLDGTLDASTRTSNGSSPARDGARRTRERNGRSARGSEFENGAAADQNGDSSAPLEEATGAWSDDSSDEVTTNGAATNGATGRVRPERASSARPGNAAQRARRRRRH